MSAQFVAKALKGKRSGRGWLCHCPVHTDKNQSLLLSDGDNGQLIVHCFADCDWKDVKDRLKALGLIEDRYWRRH